MDGQDLESGLTSAVVCAWCGSEIRREEVRGDSARESCGMCQECFRRMVEEHARVASQPPPARAYASER